MSSYKCERQPLPWGAPLKWPKMGATHIEHDEKGMQHPRFPAQKHQTLPYILQKERLSCHDQIVPWVRSSHLGPISENRHRQNRTRPKIRGTIYNRVLPIQGTWLSDGHARHTQAASTQWKEEIPAIDIHVQDGWGVGTGYLSRQLLDKIKTWSISETEEIPRVHII